MVAELPNSSVEELMQLRTLSPVLLDVSISGRSVTISGPSMSPQFVTVSGMLNPGSASFSNLMGNGSIGITGIPVTVTASGSLEFSGPNSTGVRLLNMSYTVDITTDNSGPARYLVSGSAP